MLKMLRVFLCKLNVHEYKFLNILYYRTDDKPLVYKVACCHCTFEKVIVKN